MSSTTLFVLATILAVPAAAYVQPLARGAPAARGSVAVPAAPAALSEEAAAEQGNPLPLAGLACGFGAVFGFLHARRRRVAATGALAGAAPLAASAHEHMLESSVTVAGGEEALFYVFILFATLITLVASVVFREAPRL